jgi:hypothetical protein
MITKLTPETAGYLKPIFERDFVRGSESECWIWKGQIGKTGQPRLMLCPPILAKNVAYVLAHGEIPAKHRIVQICRDDLCVNPAHLKAVIGRVEPFWNGKVGYERAEQIRAESREWARLTAEWHVRRQAFKDGFGEDPGERPTGGSIKALGKKYGLGNGTIESVINGTSWVKKSLFDVQK